jgi:hypothetical protein
MRGTDAVNVSPGMVCFAVIRYRQAKGTETVNFVTNAPPPLTTTVPITIGLMRPLPIVSETVEHVGQKPLPNQATDAALSAVPGASPGGGTTR